MAGVVEERRLIGGGVVLTFAYAQSYLDRDAPALYLPELPRRRGRQEPSLGHDAHGVIRDAAPDAWGQRVIMRRLGVGLAGEVRSRFTGRRATLRELFGRIVFNVLVGNTDDHARNHAAFWDGERLSLTPAYDICPQLRTGGLQAQAMEIDPDAGRLSQVTTCIAAARTYDLAPAEARAVVDHQLQVIHEEWSDAADVARLTDAERRALWGRQILNPPPSTATGPLDRGRPRAGGRATISGRGSVRVRSRGRRGGGARGPSELDRLRRARRLPLLGRRATPSEQRKVMRLVLPPVSIARWSRRHEQWRCHHRTGQT